MRKALLAALDFLGLIDETGRLSRTNLAVFIAIAGMVQSLVRHSTIDYGPLAAFIVALVSYQAKRYIQGQQVPDPMPQVQDALDHTKAEFKANIEQLIAAHTTIAAKVQSQANIVTAMQKRIGV